MTTEISSSPADTAGAGLETAGSNVENKTSDTIANAIEPQKAQSPAPQGQESLSATAPVVPAAGAVAPPAYVPNYKYKAALQEKELDPFFHSLIKDADSEKKIKDIFTKVDAFDFIKQKKEYAETQFDSLLADYNHQADTVQKFNKAVQSNDLSSAFRLAGLSKEQIFKWTQQQLQLMDMPAEQRQQYEQFEQTRMQKSEMEEKYQALQQQYENTTVQTRAIQLDIALSRPEVAKFAEAWDRNGEPGSFKSFVIEEAKKVYYDTKQDLSSEQAVAMVMQRFGKFLNVGDTTTQPPQAVQTTNRQNPPVIPNITGKAASPIKKVPKNLDDLKKLAKEAQQS